MIWSTLPLEIRQKILIDVIETDAIFRYPSSSATKALHTKLHRCGNRNPCAPLLRTLCGFPRSDSLSTMTICIRRHRARLDNITKKQTSAAKVVTNALHRMDLTGGQLDGYESNHGLVLSALNRRKRDMKWTYERMMEIVETLTRGKGSSHLIRHSKPRGSGLMFRHYPKHAPNA